MTGTHFGGEELPRNVLFPELEADAVAGALYNPNAGYFRPTELVTEFAERARSEGVEFRTNTEITGLETAEGGVSAVRTCTETIPVSHVVSAAGPWNRGIGRLAGLDFPIRHTLAPILKLEPTKSLPHTVPNLKHYESGCYVVGQADGSILIGHLPGSYAVGTEYDPDSVPESVPEEIESKMRAVLRELLPPLGDANVVDEWVGVRSLTPDGRPLVGPTAVDDFSLVAFNSEGIQLAPAAGRVVASRVAGTEPPAYASDVSPARFDGSENSG